MYKYEYVTVSAEMEGHLAKFNNVLSISDYRRIIDEKAADGWRYVGYMPTRESMKGYLRELDLIFEKEV